MEKKRIHFWIQGQIISKKNYLEKKSLQKIDNNTNNIPKKEKAQDELLNPKFNLYNDLLKDFKDMNEQMKLEDEKIIKQVMANLNQKNIDDSNDIKESIINEKVDEIMGNIYEQEKNGFNSKLNEEKKNLKIQRNQIRKMKKAKIVKKVKMKKIKKKKKRKIMKRMMKMTIQMLMMMKVIQKVQVMIDRKILIIHI